SNKKKKQNNNNNNNCCRLSCFRRESSHLDHSTPSHLHLGANRSPFFILEPFSWKSLAICVWNRRDSRTPSNVYIRDIVVHRECPSFRQPTQRYVIDQAHVLRCLESYYNTEDAGVISQLKSFQIRLFASFLQVQSRVDRVRCIKLGRVDEDQGQKTSIR